jgi:hypothetical protein
MRQAILLCGAPAVTEIGKLLLFLIVKNTLIQSSRLILAGETAKTLAWAGLRQDRYD